jgi:ATPase subunit of ABC transporter with duplicated ATPase domains
MITISDLAIQFGKRVLYKDVNLNLPTATYMALSVRTALENLRFSKQSRESSRPAKAPSAWGRASALSVLSQDHYKFDNCTVLNTVLMGHTVLWDIMQQKDALYAKEEFTEEDGLKAAELEDKFAELNGWNAESDAAILLSVLGIKDELHNKMMSELSGKEKVRVMLAQALYGNPDNLLLDEPTNDLDLETVGWLEDYLANFEHTVLVVSHDRHFLDAVSTHTVDIDFGKVISLPATILSGTSPRSWRFARPRTRKPRRRRRSGNWRNLSAVSRPMLRRASRRRAARRCWRS